MVSFDCGFYKKNLLSEFYQVLEYDIIQRRQKLQKKFKDLVLSIQTLLIQASYVETRHVDRTLDNSQREY